MRIHESAKRVDLLAANELDCSNLDDVIGFGVNTCSFQVERYECVLVNTGQLSVNGLVWVRLLLWHSDMPPTLSESHRPELVY